MVACQKAFFEGLVRVGILGVELDGVAGGDFQCFGEIDGEFAWFVRRVAEGDDAFLRTP